MKYLSVGWAGGFFQMCSVKLRTSDLCLPRAPRYPTLQHVYLLFQMPLVNKTHSYYNYCGGLRIKKNTSSCLICQLFPFIPHPNGSHHTFLGTVLTRIVVLYLLYFFILSKSGKPNINRNRCCWINLDRNPRDGDVPAPCRPARANCAVKARIENPLNGYYTTLIIITIHVKGL